MVALAGVLLALLLTTVAALAVPEPVLVVPGGERDGQIRLSPQTQSTTAERVTWQLANGGDEALTFAVAVHDVDTDGGDLAIEDVRDDLDLGVDQVLLAPGDVARLALTVPETLDTTAVALVARTVDAEPATELAGVLLRSDGAEVTPSVAGADVAAGTFTVHLDAAAPALVDLAVRTTAWPGVIEAEQVVEGVLVPAGGRDLDVSMAGAVIGHVTVDVVVRGTGDPVRASDTVWWWPRTLVAVAAGGLLLLAGVGAVGRRLRHRQPN